MFTHPRMARVSLSPRSPNSPNPHQTHSGTNQGRELKKSNPVLDESGNDLRLLGWRPKDSFLTACLYTFRLEAITFK